MWVCLIHWCMILNYPFTNGINLGHLNRIMSWSVFPTVKPLPFLFAINNYSIGTWFETLSLLFLIKLSSTVLTFIDISCLIYHFEWLSNDNIPVTLFRMYEEGILSIYAFMYVCMCYILIHLSIWTHRFLFNELNTLLSFFMLKLFLTWSVGPSLKWHLCVVWKISIHLWAFSYFLAEQDLRLLYVPCLCLGINQVWFLLGKNGI